MNQVISNSLGFLNNSSLFSVFITLIMNLGSRYISIDLCNFQERILSSFFVRKLCIFAIIWMATRDILLSFILTILFVFIFSGLLNSNSFLCILPKKTIKNSKTNTISTEQYQQAKKIILIDPYSETYSKSVLGDFSQLMQSSVSLYEEIIVGGERGVKFFFEVTTNSKRTGVHYFGQCLKAYAAELSSEEQKIVNLFHAAQFIRMFPFKIQKTPPLG